MDASRRDLHVDNESSIQKAIVAYKLEQVFIRQLVLLLLLFLFLFKVFEIE
jgi:hypothetical protein